MNELFEQRYLELKQWAGQAQEEGWLGEEDISALAEIERQQADALFARQGERPLVVAFFGGTGVGKSSLLNRLAGAEVARVGVERPTSQEVTLYLHQDYRLHSLPDELPLDETRIAYHDDRDRRLLAWLDMPDFDSIEEHHRELVQAWLPYVDWVVYVVSPERYQDDIGWRYVQQRGEKHAWLFVMNHWDRGDEVQVVHLRHRLEQEGFVEPLILRTSCSGTITPGDQFSQLEQTLNEAIEAYGLQLLQQIGVQARIVELQRIAARLTSRIKDYPLDELESAWQSALADGLSEVRAELVVNSRIYSGGLVQPHGFHLLPQAVPALPPLQPEAMLKTIWSARAETRLKDIAGKLQTLLQRKAVPSKPFGDVASNLQSETQGAFIALASEACTQALLQPGTRLRRSVMRLISGLGWLLPLSAAVWVAYHLVVGFYQSTQGESRFLGFNYAVHSGLLILLAWMLPWLLRRKLQPGLAEVAEAALTAGIDSGTDKLQMQGEKAFRAVVAGRDRMLSALKPEAFSSGKPSAVDPRQMEIGRVPGR